MTKEKKIFFFLRGKQHIISNYPESCQQQGRQARFCAGANQRASLVYG